MLEFTEQPGTYVCTPNVCVWHGNFKPYKFLEKNLCEDVTEL